MEATPPGVDKFETLWKGSVSISSINSAKSCLGLNTVSTSQALAVTTHTESGMDVFNCDCTVVFDKESQCYSRIRLSSREKCQEDLIVTGMYQSSHTVTTRVRVGAPIDITFNSIYYYLPKRYPLDVEHIKVDILKKSPGEALAFVKTQYDKNKICQEAELSINGAITLGNMFNKKDFSDLTIRSNEDTFYAHKFVLGQNPVFATMLQCPMKEGLSNVIEINTFDSRTVSAMLEFMYTGKAELPAESWELLELLDCATCYDLPGLKLLCFEQMAVLLSDENAARFNVAAWKHTTDEYIRKYFKDYCRARLSSIESLSDFKQLVKSCLDAFFD